MTRKNVLPTGESGTHYHPAWTNDADVMAAVARSYLDDCAYLSSLSREALIQLSFAEDSRVWRAATVGEQINAIWRGSLCVAWMVGREHNLYLNYLPRCYANLVRIAKLPSRLSRESIRSIVLAAHSVVSTVIEARRR